MKRNVSLVFVLVAGFLLAMNPAAAQTPGAPGFYSITGVPYGPRAYPGPTSALWTNPAGIGADGSSGLMLMNFFTAGNDMTNVFQRDWGIGVNIDGLGFGVESSPVLEASRKTWGTAIEVAEGFNLGVAYHWSKGLDRKNSYDLGLLMRPTQWLSIGAQVTEVGRPVYDGVRRNPSYHLGLAARPFGPMLTLTADATLWKMGDSTLAAGWDETEIAYGDKPDLTFTAEFQPLENIALRGGYAMDSEMIFAGLSIYSGVAELSNYTAQRSKTTAGTPDMTGTNWVRFSSTWRPCIRDYFGSKKVVSLTLKGKIVEEPMRPSLFSLNSPTLLSWLKKIERLRDDPQVTGIVLNIKGFSMGLSSLIELRDALLDFRQSGKKLIVYTHEMGLGSYFLASAADRIVIHPAGGITMPGLNAKMPFFKGLLDKVGVEAQFIHVGKYKSAAEVLTRDGMSDPARESLDAVVETIWNVVLDGIAEARNVEREQVESWINNAVYDPDAALEAGLVDAIAYDDEKKDQVDAAFDGVKTRLVSRHTYFKFEPQEYVWEDMTSPKIAVVYATGNIKTGKSSGGFLSGKTMGSDTIVKAIRKARADKRVKAIVFRIDSGGGSALASDIILREVERTTDKDSDARHIPVIVSMANVAGSGGYYIACKADTIVAPVTSITGSIGVIGGKFVTKGLTDKVGITYDGVHRGENFDLNSTSSRWNDKQLEMMQNEIEKVYDMFVNNVSEGRGLDTSAVHEIAQGRIWSGEDARELGLVDVNGGFLTAIAIAKEAAGIKEGRSVEMEVYPRVDGLEIDNEFKVMLYGSLPETVKSALKAESFVKSIGEGEPLMLCPVTAEFTDTDEDGQ